MPPVLILLRHGETHWNTLGRYQGAQDSPLTQRGKEQAAAIGRLLARLLSHAVEDLPAFTSPLGRAVQTAMIINRHRAMRLTLEPKLREVSIGSWDGLTDFEIEAEHPGVLDGADAFNWFFRSPDGEPLDAVIRRVDDWLSCLETPAVAISHGLIGRIIRGRYLGLGTDSMLRLDVPQDGVHVLSRGQVNFVGVDN